MIGVVADLGGEVEGDGEPGLSLLKEVVVAAVALVGGAKAGVLAHGPEAAAVHVRLHAAGERILAGKAKLALVMVVTFIAGRDVGWCIEGLDGDGRAACGKAFHALRDFFEDRRQGIVLPVLYEGCQFGGLDGCRGWARLWSA